MTPEIYHFGQIQIQHRGFATFSVTALPQYEESPSTAILQPARAPLSREDFPPPYWSDSTDPPQQLLSRALVESHDSSGMLSNDESTLPPDSAVLPDYDGINRCMEHVQTVFRGRHFSVFCLMILNGIDSV
jgi:hypothetical protein